ncbi:MAG: SAM-dependent methyltransferase [Kofleriaceae bacterium]
MGAQADEARVVKDERPSFTAAWVAAARTFGELLPDELHLADDPYGAAFAKTRLHERLRDTQIGRTLALSPGLGTWIMYMQVRTRVLDDIARAFAKREGAQLVLLGAGYDTRALRLSLGMRVFEVDHPATQRRKQRVLDRLGTHSPATYVTWDFEQRPMDELADALADAGLDRDKPVLTIWEGVTMYLSEGAIEASLAAIREFGGAGSQLAMTYFERERIDRPHWMMRIVRTAVRGIGEPFVWGWDHEQLPAYLAERGFRVVANRSVETAALDYVPERIAKLTRARNSCIALADVI